MADMLPKNPKPEYWQDSYKWEFQGFPFFLNVFTRCAAPATNRYHATWDPFLCSVKDGNFTGLLPKKVLNKPGNRIIRELLAGNDGYLRELKITQNELLKVIKVCEQARRPGNYAKMESWWPQVHNALSNASALLFHFDFTLDEYLADLRLKSPGNYSVLSSHIGNSGLSFMDQARYELVRLSRKYPGNFDEVYNQFMRKYGWFQNSYAGVYNVTKPWLKKLLKEQTHSQLKRKISATTLKSLPRKYTLLAKAANACIPFKDDKKRLLLIASELMERWLKSTCQRHGWDYEVMRWLTVGEVQTAASDTSFAARARRYHSRQERVGIMIADGFADIPKAFWRQAYATATRNEKPSGTITGVGASNGTYRGTAKIILNPRAEFNKFRQGDILVTSMTRPEYLPLMSKAGAFVTDEGGLSCHAAIVAREMGKPCIIATKNATRILKDGDRVEVDANQGVIKKLNK